MMNTVFASQGNQVVKEEVQTIELYKNDSVYKSWTKKALALFMICIALKYTSKENNVFVNRFLEFPLKILQGLYGIGLSINTFTILENAIDTIFKKYDNLFKKVS